MKGLDTPILLGILHGSGKARQLLQGLKGEEIATTELNFLELETIARRGGRRGQAARSQAIDRLRRGLTVVPITAEMRSAAPRARLGGTGISTAGIAIYAAMDVAGCEEWYTTPPFAVPGDWRFRTRVVTLT